MLFANVGRRFNGKTTLAVWTLDQCERRAFLDVRSQIRRPGSIVVRRLSRLREAFDALANGDVDEIVYSPIEPHRVAFDAFAGELRRWVIEYPTLPLGVLIDEAGFFKKQIDDVDGPFQFVIKTCDPAIVDIVLTCHRPTDLPTDVRALCNRLAWFRTTLEHDLQAVRAHCGPDVEQLVQDLPDRHYVAWNDDDATYDVHCSPFIWRTDLTVPGAAARILELQ
jgi:hypothetical protein